MCLGKRLPRLRPGDEVDGLLVKQVDLERNALILAGHHIEVTSSSDRVHRHPSGRRLEDFDEGSLVSGRMLHFISDLGMVFDVGAQRDALMPIRLFKKKLPTLRIGRN